MHSLTEFGEIFICTSYSNFEKTCKIRQFPIEANVTGTQLLLKFNMRHRNASWKNEADDSVK